MTAAARPLPPLAVVWSQDLGVGGRPVGGCSCSVFVADEEDGPAVASVALRRPLPAYPRGSAAARAVEASVLASARRILAEHAASVAAWAPVAAGWEAARP